MTLRVQKRESGIIILFSSAAIERSARPFAKKSFVAIFSKNDEWKMYIMNERILTTYTIHCTVERRS